MIPDDLLYTKYHLWVRWDGELVETGVTEPLLRKLTPLISIELPGVDDELKEEIPFGEIEGRDETFQFYPPAEGRIVEANGALVCNHQQLVDDPYGEGWFLRFRAHEPEELEHLWSAALYKTFCADDLGEEYLDEQ